MKRRKFLKQATLAATFASVGGVWRAFPQGQPEFADGPAFEPWRTWLEGPASPLALVRSAILSSNAFNTQPWLFRVQPNSIDLLANTKRNLGAFDPYLREMHFSLGCAIENLLLAAPANAFRGDLTFLHGRLDSGVVKAEPELVARIALSATKPARSALYDAIPHRHTNRDAFLPDKPLSAEFLDGLKALAADEPTVKLFLFSSESQRKKLVDLIVASSQLLADPEVQQGTRPWLRPAMADWQKSPDGSYIGPGSGARITSLDQYAALMMTGPLFGLIAVRDRLDREQTIRAGRVWQRTHLFATAHGVAARPANGAVEKIDYERRLQQEARTSAQLAAVTGDATWQPTFMFYMGYPTVPAPASARCAVRDVVLS